MNKVLIIQDSSSINALLKSRLESEGFLVDTTETGEEGIEKADIGQYDVILLDYKLPGIDGPEVCRILKGKKTTKNIPILFMSVTDKDELYKIIDDVDAQGCITMPFQKEELLRSIRSAIKSDKA